MARQEIIILIEQNERTNTQALITFAKNFLGDREELVIEQFQAARAVAQQVVARQPE